MIAYCADALVVVSMCADEHRAQVEARSDIGCGV